MGVLGSQRADRGVPDVADEKVCAHVGGERGDLELRALVDGAAPHEYFTALIKPEAPTEWHPLRASTQRLFLEGKHAPREVWPVADDAEESGHVSLLCTHCTNGLDFFFLAALENVRFGSRRERALGCFDCLERVESSPA
jgi:hypothetical protein